MKRRLLLIALMMLVLLTTIAGSSAAEETEAAETLPVFVTATLLNGRAKPSKRAKVEAIFDQGDRLQPTGRISRDREWVEVAGGETGTVWVHIKYISERRETFTVTNENNGKIKIHSKRGGGRVREYARRGATLEIDRVLMGWGHCAKGWVDLEYFIEEV